MEAYPFVGNDSDSLMQKIYAIKHIKKLGYKKCQNFSWRATKNNQLFYIYNDPFTIYAQTVVPYVSPNFETHYKVVDIGSVFYLFNKKDKNFHISYIKTLHDFKRMGIADQLLDYSKILAKKLGARTITLDRLCTYTDGETVLPFRGDPQDFTKLKELRNSGKKIIDINLNLYAKHGFIKQTNRAPEQGHLVPMVTNKLKPAPNKITSISKVFYFKSKQPLNIRKYVIKTIPENMKDKNYRVFDFVIKNMI